MAKQLNVNLAFTADTSQAKAQIQELQTTLNQIAYAGNSATGMNKQTQAIQQASAAAKELQLHLNNAFDATTGRFDLSKLDRSLKASGSNIGDLSTKLLLAGKTGQQAFAQLAQSISQANQPMLSVNKHLTEMWTVMKNTMRWQLSSSMIHGFIGTVQKAYGYVKDLNESLNNIRIVTGNSVDEMAEFAKYANRAAKELSATTTEYTNASLIYYQQGLSDEEVKARTDVTIKMANAAGESAEKVSDQLTAVWNNFAKGGENLEYYADVMTALGAATASSTDEIAAGLEKFAAIAETVGLSYEYATASLATITATTRQSADVVGNALKTLFARIQGLKLGETLEDGVDLNKYSQALNAVGVDVLTANGELRNMDDILDDLAAKWDTIGKAEQTALAQTVAGVRQYTQLVALMDNWDFMKDNLQVAYDAEGTLQEQADIYAESWEAARDRVKAAAEGIYDSLLNDEFFININNGFANLLGGLESFIDGIGGAKGIILAFSSILLSNFSHKIPQAIDNLRYNINVLTQGAQQAYVGIQQSMSDTASKAFSSGTIKQDSSIGFQIESANKLTVAKTAMAAVNNRLTDSERQVYQMSISMSEAMQQEIIQLHQKKEALEQNNVELMNMAAQQGLEVMENRLATALDNSIKLPNLRQKLEQETGAIASVGENLGRQLMEGVKKGSDSINIGASIQPVTNRIKELVQSFNTGDYSSFNNIKKELNVLKDLLPEATSKALGLDEALKKIAGTSRPIKAQAAFLELQKILDNTTISANQARQILSKDFNFKGITQYRTNLKEIDGLNKQIKTSTEQWKQAIESFNPKHTVNKIERISQAAAGLGQIAMTMTSINSLFKTLSNPDLSGWEKLSGSLMAISMIIPGIIGTFRSFNLVLDGALSSLLSQILANKTLATVENQRLLEQIQGELLLQAIKNRGSKEDYAKLFAKTLIQKRIVVGITEEALAQKILNGEKITATRVTAAKILADFLETKGIQVKTISIWGCVKAMGAYLLATHPLIAATLGLAAAIGLAIGVYKNYLYFQETATEKNENASKTLKTLKTNYEEAANAVKSLKQAIEDYNSTQDALSKLTEGSVEWKQALVEANAQVMSLLETYPELAKYINSNGGVLTIDSKGWDFILERQLKQSQKAQSLYMSGVASKSETEGMEKLTNASIGQSINLGGEMESIQIADFGSDMIEILYDEIGNSIKTAEDFKKFLQDNGLWDVLGQYSDIDIQKIITDVTTQKFATAQATESAIITSQELTGNYAEAEAATILNSDQYQTNYNKEKNRLDRLGRFNQQKLNEEYLKFAYGEDYADSHKIEDGKEYTKIDGTWQEVGEIAKSAIIEVLSTEYANKNTLLTDKDRQSLAQNKEQLFKIDGMTDEQANSMMADYARTGVWDANQLSWDQILSFKDTNADEILGIKKDQVVENKQIETMQSNQSYLGAYEQLDSQDLNENINTLEMSQDGLEMYKDKIKLSKEYQEAVERENLTEEDKLDLLESTAEANLDAAAHLKKLKAIVEDYNEAIENGSEIERAEAIAGMQKELENWFGVAFSAKEVEEYSKDIQKALEGDADSIAKLYDYAAEKSKDSLKESVAAFESAGGELDETIKNSLNLTGTFDNLTSVAQSAFDAINNQDWKFGDSLGAEATNAFNALLASGAITADSLNTYLSNVGFDPVISYKAMTLGEAKSTKQVSYMMNADGTYTEVTSETDLKDDAIVYVPVLGEKTKYTGTPTPPNMGGSKNSGGGGGSSKKPTKKNTSDKERYHTLTNQLEDIEKEYDAISEAAERAFGKDKLKLIDDQIAKLDEEIDKQEELIEAVSADLPNDRNIMTEYYNSVFGDMGKPIEFDARGNISNFDEIQNVMFNKWDQMAEKYTEDDEAWQVFEQKYEQFEKYLEQYEETYDKLKDEEEKQQELINQRTDLLLEQVQYALELKLNLNEDGLNLLDYQLSKIDDDAFKAAESIALIGKQADLLYQQMMIDRDGLKNILSLTIDSKSTVNQILDGEYVDLSGYNFTEDQISALKEYRDNLLDANEQMAELRDTVQEKLSDAFDAWNEKVQKGIDGIEHYGSVIEHYGNIIDTVGQEFLGVTDDLMASLNQSSVDNAIANLTAVKNQYEAIESARKNAEDKLNNAKTEEDIKFWQEQLDTLTEESRDAADNVLSAWEETLSSAVSAFEASVERAMNAFNMSVYADGGLEGLGEDFERQQKLSDMYLQDYKQIYELSKLNRDINNSIDDTKSLAGKQKLKKLLEEINDIQESGLEMSEYDLEYLQAEYDLRLAEIALEEAQNAKDTVRLQKDNEGNWSYVYTSSTDAVDEAQQKYEDALYAMQDLSSNYINEMSDQLIQTSQEMAEELANLRIEDFASIDDYYTKVKEIQDSYAEEMALQEGELNKAIANNKELYDTDWTNYHNATGYKISDTEEFVTRFSDSMLGLLMGSEEESSVFADFINNAAITLTESLRQNAKSYEENVKNAMTAAGTSLEDFANQTETYLGKVKQATITAAGEVNTATGEMKQGFADLSDEIAGWQNTYGAAADSVIAKNEELINSMNKLLTALSIDEDDIMVDYTIKTVPAFSEEDIPEEASAATGGYTGDWAGNSGRLALLHKRELILDDNDTSNFVTALGLTKDILQVIDLNAKQASLAYGPMTASTLRDEATQMLEQSVHITAEFPNVQDKNEIQEAFNNLINTASQYANRK